MAKTNPSPPKDPDRGLLSLFSRQRRKKHLVPVKYKVTPVDDTPPPPAEVWADTAQTLLPLPTYQKLGKTEIDTLKIGINQSIYERLVQAANNCNCIIMIRKTNPGSVVYFDKCTGVGKKLPTKGKSSSSYFTVGSIPFFASLAKKVGNWYYEQTTLIEVTTLKTRTQEAKYTFIPKFIALNSELLRSASSTAVKNDTFSKGSFGFVTVVKFGNDLRVVVSSDNFEGAGKRNEYYLERVNFATVNQQNYGNTLATPSFLIGKKSNEQDCYLVYISQATIEKTVIPDIRASDYDATKYLTDIGQGKDTSWTKFWADLWKNRKIDNSALGAKYGTALLAPLANFAAEKSFDKIKYYPVNVLALYTRGKVTAPFNNVNKLYYEVVADYDTFMIAPHIQTAFGPIPNATPSPKPPTADEIEQAWWSNNPINPKYIPQSDPGRATTGAADPNSRIAKGGKPRYGIVSDFELGIKKEMNKQLGIKAVQHGTEVANLFFTSDIFEPLILILPGAKDIYKDLFFLDLKMLFELMSYSVTDRNFNTVGMAASIDAEAAYTIPAGLQLANDYAFVFNLNWGTDYYLDLIFGNNDTPKTEARGHFTKLVTGLYEVVNPNTESETTDSIFAAPNPYATSSFPIKALMLFLHQNYKMLIVFDCISAMKQNPSEQDKIDKLLFHYKFIKKLMYMAKYYQAVHGQAAIFAKLVHQDANVIRVRPSYVEAIKAICIIAKKYQLKYFENTPPPNEKKSFWGKAKEGTVERFPGKIKGFFNIELTEWIKEMNAFIQNPT